MTPQDNPEKWSQVVLRLQAQTREREAQQIAQREAYSRLFHHTVCAGMLALRAEQMGMSPALQRRLWAATRDRRNALRTMRLMGVAR